MKQIINYAAEEVSAELISDAPIPEPNTKQVLIKVVVSGSNPKDWKAPMFAANYSGPDDGSMMARCKAGVNQGDDIAGIVEKVGKDVLEFKVRSNSEQLECKKNERDANVGENRRETASLLSTR
jgi:NADPH:quinone reductase-like Zn-dependent oxidoreductase